jgi:hypothetical protein
MKKAWKWILGIVLVLVVIAAFIVVPLVLHNVWGYGIYDRDFGMMGRHSFMPFGGFMMLGMGLRWLVPLGLIGLLAYGAFRYGQRKAAPVIPPAAPAAPAPEVTCPKCGQPVQAGWNNCANCGKKL